MPKLTFKSNYPVSPEELFAWHERADSLLRLTPPWIRTVLKQWEGIRDGCRTVMQISRGPLSSEWVAMHEDYVRGEQFTDYQESGPFQYWRHVHKFEPLGESGSQLTDEIDFQLKGGNIGERLASGYVRRQIERAFAYRHRITGQDLLVHRQYNVGKTSLRIGITGASGFVGSELASFFGAGGHKVTRIVRRRSTRPGDVYWDPTTGEIDRSGLEGLDAVIHLAGESIMALRWNAAKKKRIRESRLQGTRLLATTLASLEKPPTAFLTASALGIYGSHGSNAVSEASVLKSGGFLSTLAKDWEAAADPAVKKGIRTVFLRFGIILSPRGGMLKQILPLFSSGLGGSFSPGDQWMSWISMDDVLGAVYHTMMSSAAGPVNVNSPFPLTMQQFARCLGQVIRRPAFFRTPSSIVRRALGEVADEVFLASIKAHPEYLTTSSYQFLYPQLEGALRHLLGREAPKHLELSEISDRRATRAYFHGRGDRGTPEF